MVAAIDTVDSVGSYWWKVGLKRDSSGWTCRKIERYGLIRGGVIDGLAEGNKSVVAVVYA